MNIFQKIKEKRMAIRRPAGEELVVAVPDIKEYLLREYEKVNDLKLVNEGLVQRLDKAKETEMKYGAAMATLDEYSRRLKRSEEEIESWKGRADAAQKRFEAERSAAISYKIKLNEVDREKEKAKKEVVEQVKKELALEFENHKGTLSKKTACEIIMAYRRGSSNEAEE